MTQRTLLCVFLLSPCHLVTLSPCHARADGGAVRLYERAGNYQLAVFTLPTLFRVGPVDVSVLVQDTATGECAAQTRVALRLTAQGSGRVLEQPATFGAGSNKLLHE